ncbi:uncharacterized protein LOC142333665 [Lycorma delicatula]|uniref:uncharacterized protein LOC142333665 n=1 Tax=Lycorma delicatula TaxID=130591 RepID=UPI003F510F71
MWRIQVLLMYFILTTMLVGSNNVCKKYRNGIHKENENRNYGYTDKQTIQSYSNMYCEKFGKKPERRIYNIATCSLSTDKYLKLVGDTEDDINMFAESCVRKGFKWHDCINVMLFLEKRCWDMHNATILIDLVTDLSMLWYIVIHTNMSVHYAAILRLRNFQPHYCINDILVNSTIRDTIFDQFYYSWFKNQPNAKGCNCNKVINLYNSADSSEERVKLLESECL